MHRSNVDADAAGLNKIYRFINQMTHCLCKVFCVYARACVRARVRNLYVSQQIGTILMTHSTRESAGSIQATRFEHYVKCAGILRNFYGS